MESNPVEDVEALILDWSDSCSACLFCVTLFTVEIVCGLTPLSLWDNR